MERTPFKITADSKAEYHAHALDLEARDFEPYAPMREVRSSYYGFTRKGDSQDERFGRAVFDGAVERVKYIGMYIRKEGEQA